MVPLTPSLTAALPSAGVKSCNVRLSVRNWLLSVLGRIPKRFIARWECGQTNAILSHQRPHRWAPLLYPEMGQGAWGWKCATQVSEGIHRCGFGLATLSTFDTQHCCWSLLLPSSIWVAWSACENGRALQCILSTGCLCVCSACSCRVGTNRHLLHLAWARPPEPWQPRDGRHEPYVRFRLPEGPTRMRMRNHLPKGQGSN
jgi:hypothetical protein